MELMLEDKRIAHIEKGNITFIDKKLCPALVQKGAFEQWVESRAIDKHRTNSRSLKKMLRLSSAEDFDVAMKFNAATITDRYWVKTDDFKVWDQVRFDNNPFDKVALYGDINGFELGIRKTPELTNTGSYEKCWRLENGRWWMYKKQSDDESYSELFCEAIGKKLGFDMAHYERTDCGVKTLDFTNAGEVSLEHVSEYVGDEVDYSINYNLMKEFGFNSDFIKMIYLDSLCMNIDRHTENYGFLRDRHTGDYLQLAPNYDNNMSLLSRGIPTLASGKNFTREFVDLLRENQNAHDDFVQSKIPLLNKEELLLLSNAIGGHEKQNELIDFVLNMQDYLHSII